MDPRPLKLRDLSYMVDGHVEEKWNHTASILAMIHNVNCVSKRDRVNADYFNPFSNENKNDMVTDDIEELFKGFV